MTELRRKLLDSAEKRWLGPGPPDRPDPVAPLGVVIHEYIGEETR